MKGFKTVKISRTLKNQIKDFINQGKTVIEIINYLFTCDYSATEVVKILVKNFGCQEQLIKDVLKVDFGIEFSPFVTVA